MKCPAAVDPGLTSSFLLAPSYILAQSRAVLYDHLLNLRHTRRLTSCIHSYSLHRASPACIVPSLRSDLVIQKQFGQSESKLLDYSIMAADKVHLLEPASENQT